MWVFCLGIIALFLSFDIYANWNVTSGIDISARLYNKDDSFFVNKQDFEWDPSLWFDVSYSNNETRLDFAFKPVFGIAPNNNEVPNFDVSELFVRKQYQDWQWQVGMDTIFWGVAESRHLVDTVNQIVFVRNLEGESKLGELILRLDYFTENGRLSFLSLPAFRERRFAEHTDRLSIPGQVIDSTFVGQSKHDHSSYIVRYSMVLDDWDLAAYHYDGMGREPTIIPSEDMSRGLNNSGLIAVYQHLTQWALEAQYTSDNWLGKFEAVHRDKYVSGDSWAYIAGLEYYFYGVFLGTKDLSVLVELLRDTDQFTQENKSFNNSTFAGLRLTWNDDAETSLLLGTMIDNNGDSITVKGNFDTRINDNLSIKIEARVFTEQERFQPLYAYKDDDFFQVTLNYFF